MTYRSELAMDLGFMKFFFYVFIPTQLNQKNKQTNNQKIENKNEEGF